MTRTSTDPSVLPDRDLTGAVSGAFFQVFRVLGHGFVESVYERALLAELRKRGIAADRQVGIQVWYDGAVVVAFRADMLVEGRLVVELKAAARLEPSHRAQLVNYLKAGDLPVGLLLNFGPVPEFIRVVGPAARRTLREPGHEYYGSVSSVSSVVLLPLG